MPNRPDRTYALTDITAAQLRLLTDFSYSGRLPRHATAPVLLQALRLAHRYQMQHCLETVVARLKATMELENESVFAIYSAALDLNVKPLVEAVRSKDDCVLCSVVRVGMDFALSDIAAGGEEGVRGGGARLVGGAHRGRRAVAEAAAGDERGGRTAAGLHAQQSGGAARGYGSSCWREAEARRGVKTTTQQRNELLVSRPSRKVGVATSLLAPLLRAPADGAARGSSIWKSSRGRGCCLADDPAADQQASISIMQPPQQPRSSSSSC